MDDKEAVEKTLGGTVEAFGYLVSRYQSIVHAIALARVYDHQDAQDLSQEAFLRAYVRLPMLRNRDAFAPWLFMIVRRLSLDFMRGRWRNDRERQSLHECEQLSHDPRQQIKALDTARTLWSRVGQLDDKSREVLSLHYGQELKVSEIAALTATKESAVKMRLQKARAVLGDKVGDLKGVWAVAPLPTFPADIMKAVNSVGPFKEGILASSGLGGALAVPALFSVFWWSALRDVNRWEGHAPAGMLAQARRTLLRSVLFIAAAMIAAIVIAALFATAIVLIPPRGQTQILLVPHWAIYGVFLVSYGIIIAAALGAIFKREIDLLAPRDKARQVVGACCAFLVAATASLSPAHGLLAMGAFLFLHYFFVNKSNIALAAVPPGLWVGPLLKHSPSSEVRAVPVTTKQIKPWLTMLHEYGLVAPPLRSDKEAFTVRLRLRGSLFEKMARGKNSSFLRVETTGVVSCTIVPRDYVAIAQHLGLDEVPGRQELAASLGNSFTRALSTYAEGGDKEAVASSLGLAHCPIETTNTYGFFLNKYALPIIGLLLIALYVLRFLR